MPVSSIFEIGKRSLLAYQSAIQTTSGNISNSNDENYARRRAELSQMIGGFSALGFSTEESTRLRQRFAENQLWQENQDLNQYQANNMLLTQVEDIFAEDTESGLSSLLTQFWNSWSDLANDPESDYARAIVKDKGVLVTNAFNRMHRDLREMQGQIRPEVDTRIEQINQKLEQLSGINQKLRYQNDPNLMDQRDLLIKDLSSEFDIRVKELDTGEVSIYVDGYVLVSDQTVNLLKSSVETIDGENQIKIFLGNTDKEVNVQSGTLQGLIHTHNEEIVSSIERLNELAVYFAESVNTLHLSGENANGTTNINFFASDVSSAADFRVNDAVLQDISLIATRLPGEEEGSGSIAQSISDLQFNEGLNGSTGLEFYHGMLTEIGNKIQEAEFLEQSQSLIVAQLQNQKDTVTGVSLDEEMTRLIQFEQAYQAAAKVINTVDEMVNTILSLK